MRRSLKRLLFLAVVLFLLAGFSSPSFSQDSPQVTVEIGPTFGDDPFQDRQLGYNCLFYWLGGRFPWDLVRTPTWSESGDCPRLEIFNNVYDACFIVDIYGRIRPAILGGLMVYGIFHL